MDDQLLPECPHCGERHEPSNDMLALVSTMVPAVSGSRMRRGGSYTNESGLTIGSGEWRQLRCTFCGSESMTPIEMIPPGSMQSTDGAYIGHCGSCQFDLESGYRPGHNPHQSRRRRRR
jgi:hypothetical protein